MKSLLILFLFPAFAFAQNANSVTHYFYNDLEAQSYGFEWINMNTKTEGAGHSGKYYSKTDGENPYSVGIDAPIPHDLEKRNFTVSIRVWVRMADTSATNQLVVSISKNDSTIFWKGRPVKTKFARPGKWALFTDAVLVPRNIPPKSKLKIYIWNHDGKIETNVDDLVVYISTVELPSFLPQ